jgi:opine dehydrogenase
MGAMSIAVLGGGNGAFAAAADLSLRGHDVRLLEVPELQQSIAPVLEAGGILLENAKIAEIGSGNARIALVTTDPKAALGGAELVLYLVPAFAERRFTELVAPYLQPDQLVVLFCGSVGGALALAAQMQQAGLPIPLIAETEALVYAALKSGPAGVRVMGRKAGVGVSTLPAGKVGLALDRLRPLYPDFTPRTDVLETGLRNTNPIAHVPSMVLNAGRIAPTVPPYGFYKEGFPAAVGAVAEAADAERVRVAQGFGYAVASTRDTMLAWYGDQGAHGETLAEVFSTNPPFQTTKAPQTLEHRFLTEDVPFGFVPFEALGELAGVATPAISALITVASLLLGRDLRASGRNQDRLGVRNFSMAQIRQVLRAGEPSGRGDR